jgi:hypothetical protein
VLGHRWSSPCHQLPSCGRGAFATQRLNAALRQASISFIVFRESVPMTCRMSCCRIVRRFEQFTTESLCKPEGRKSGCF